MSALNVSAEDVKRVKGMGFLNNKGTDNFNGRIITINGKITAAQQRCIAEAAEKFGCGEVAFTTRITIEVPGIPYEKIEVVIHPESIVHSAVEFKDGSTVAQIGTPSMHIPIQYALTCPNREIGIKSNSFNFIGQKLTFEKPDFEKFPCLKLAYEAGKTGGTMPVVLNAANEVAVHKFLKGEIGSVLSRLQNG